MFRLDIVVDFVCPWCFIGRRRLAAAAELVRRRRGDFHWVPFWRPFFLNPDTPPEGEPYRPFLEKKFGGPEKVEELFARVREAGQAWGIPFAFEKIARRANTLAAHRLIHHLQHGGADPERIDALVERIYVGYFQRGEYIGDPTVLAGYAGELGFSPQEVIDFLSSTAERDAVIAAEAEIRARGVQWVPTFLLPDGQVVVGAEDPAVLATAIERALSAR